MIDAKLIGCAVLFYQDVALVSGLTDLQIAYACFIKECLERSLILIAHLYDNTGIFSEENLHEVCFLELVEVDAETAFRISEAHFKQCSNHTTRRNVVTSHKETLFNQLLNSIEGIAEIFGVLNCRNIATYAIQTLCECRTTEAEFIEREVDVIECRLFAVYYHGAYYLTHIAHFTTCTDDYSTRRNNLFIVRILLRH